MSAVADEYTRARDALLAVRPYPDGQALAFGLAEAIGDLARFGMMVSLTREAEALIGRKAQAAPTRQRKAEHVVFAVAPTLEVMARLDALGVTFEVKAVATETWDSAKHPRDREGRFAHVGTGIDVEADLRKLFGQLDYSPDRDASHEGDFERDPEGAPKRWRQQHLELVTEALRSFVRSPYAVQVHMNSAFEGRPQPPSGVGQRHRAQAAALLWELEHGSRPNTVPLYRATAASVTAPDTWTEDLKVAQHLADLAGGEVVTLPRGEGRGLRIDDYIHSGLELSQQEWIMFPQDIAGLLQPDALTANRKAGEWNARKHPRDSHGRFAHVAGGVGELTSESAVIGRLTPPAVPVPDVHTGDSSEVRRVLARLGADEGLSDQQRAEPHRLEEVGGLIEDAVTARTAERLDSLKTQRYELENQYADAQHERDQTVEKLGGFLLGPQHGRTDLTPAERTERDRVLAHSDEIERQQQDLHSQIVLLRKQENDARREAIVDVLGQVRPMGGEFRTAETVFATQSGIVPQQAYEGHTQAVAEAQRLMPSAWVAQMNAQGSVHWHLWKQARGWQRAIPNSSDKPTSVSRKNFASDEGFMAEVARRAQAAGVQPSHITFSGDPLVPQSRFAFWYAGPDSEVKATAGDAGLYLHELAHRVQLVNPTGPLHAAQANYLDLRTAPDDPRNKPRPLSDIYPGRGYREDERAREDEFVNAYYGKLYGPTYEAQYNELLTMAMQDLFFNTENLRTKDPQTYQWILGVLATL